MRHYDPEDDSFDVKGKCPSLRRLSSTNSLYRPDLHLPVSVRTQWKDKTVVPGSLSESRDTTDNKTRG